MLNRVSLGGRPHVTLLVASLILFITACFTIVPAHDTADRDNAAITPERLNTADMARTYKLEVIAEPNQSASFTLSPTPDIHGAFPSGTQVTIEVLANPGWVIQEWDGPVEHTTEDAAQITMDQDHTLVLHMASAE